MIALEETWGNAAVSTGLLNLQFAVDPLVTLVSNFGAPTAIFIEQLSGYVVTPLISDLNLVSEVTVTRWSGSGGDSSFPGSAGTAVVTNRWNFGSSC